MFVFTNIGWYCKLRNCSVGWVAARAMSVTDQGIN
jgi:hypothetical protein